MPFTAALSTASNTSQALGEVCAICAERFQGKPDLALVFFSAHHAGKAEGMARTLRERFEARCLLGCNGEAIVGNDQEIENEPALSLWLGGWSKPVDVEPFHLVWEETAEGQSLLGWPDALEDADPKQAGLLVLGDPFTFPTDLFLQEMNEQHKGLRVMGGMASGAGGPGESRLVLGGDVHQAGAVGIMLQGPVQLRSVVSQGCRPIGRHMVITRGQENVILELGGKPPLAQLRELWEHLSPRDQALLQEGLHLGRVINEYQDQFRRGDFLIRNVIGLDQDTGALAITDRVRPGQTVQFHVRDAHSADEDLHEMLKSEVKGQENPAAGALLFTCNGRGRRLFSEPHHDARVIRSEVGNIPLAGFFAAGELGPVSGQNFIHGFTASVVLFEE